MKCEGVTKTLMAGQESMLHVLKLLGTKTIRIRDFLSNCLCLNCLRASQPTAPPSSGRGARLSRPFFNLRHLTKPVSVKGDCLA